MRIGIDLGGTKIEGIVMGEQSVILERMRQPTPQGDYAATLQFIKEIVRALEQAVGAKGLPVGIGTPGAISPASGLMKNANSTCLNGQALKQDIEAELGRSVRMANDADCLALSEASDGAAAGARSVFAVILGTGVGGGLCYQGQLLTGPNAIAGEWGHNPLPWPKPEWDEIPGPLGWDGRYGSIESYLSGVGFAEDHERRTTQKLAADEIFQAAEAGETESQESMQRYEDRLARALATIINVFDPDVIVAGGGVSNIERIYQNVPKIWQEWVFSDQVATRFVPAQHGDSSGVRGAAWLNEMA